MKRLIFLPRQHPTDYTMSILENFVDAPKETKSLAETYDDDVSDLFAATVKQFLDVNFDKVKNLTIDEDDEDMEDEFISKEIQYGNLEMNFMFAITDNKWTRMLSIQILEDGEWKMSELYELRYYKTKEQLLQSIESDFFA